MQRDDIVNRLRADADRIKRLGVTSLYLFGSFARGEGRQESDVDVLVDYDHGQFGLLEMARLKRQLSELLGRSVDVGTRDSLHPLMRREVEDEAVQVF